MPFTRGDSMTTAGIKPHLKRVKKMALAHLSTPQMAKKLGVSPRTVRNYLSQLLYMGELVTIGPPNSTPRIYEDGKPDNYPPFSYNPTDSQIEENSPIPKRVVPSTDDAENLDEHKKMVRFHCTGAWTVIVKTMGDHAGAIRDAGGYTVGGWSEITAPNNSKRQYGRARLYPNEDIRFTLYLARAGPKLTVTPNPRYVYYRGSNITGPRALAEQVYKLMDLLTLGGWVFDQIDDKTIEHYAMDDADLSYLLSLANRNTDPDNARVHVDTSNGTPEIEVYNDHPGAYNDVVTIYELPQRIESITASLTALHGTITALARNMDQLTELTAKLVNNQAQQATILNGQYVPATHDNRGYY